MYLIIDPDATQVAALADNLDTIGDLDSVSLGTANGLELSERSPHYPGWCGEALVFSEADGLAIHEMGAGFLEWLLGDADAIDDFGIDGSDLREFASRAGGRRLVAVDTF